MRKLTIQRRCQFSFYKIKTIKKPDFIILYFPVLLIQKSWLEMHMNKNVWIYRTLFSAVYTYKWWITSFNETVKRSLQQHQLNWFKKLSRPCPKPLNDKGYAPNNNRSCLTTTPAAILSLKPWLVSSRNFGPRLYNIWFFDVIMLIFYHNITALEEQLNCPGKNFAMKIYLCKVVAKSAKCTVQFCFEILPHSTQKTTPYKPLFSIIATYSVCLLNVIHVFPTSKKMTWSLEMNNWSDNLYQLQKSYGFQFAIREFLNVLLWGNLSTTLKKLTSTK